MKEKKKMINKSTIFVKHHDYNIKEDDRFLNIFFETKEQAQKRVEILREKYPDREYEIKYIGNNVNDLKMRIVDYLERFTLPKYILEINGERYNKIFMFLDQIEEKIEELKEKNPNINTRIIKISNSKKYPKYLSLEQCDYDLLKKDRKIKEDDITFGMKIIIDKKKGKKYE